uniref:Uncharacterized protein n=1 Tax=Polytomella parva TaxID=51329 RepID=A0A7S0YR94_9CHLO|mmetsp:Transcript_8973/g.16936  ORF Transcript_8973/g.16936 Transcript_8973/m.16936 type:complete len:379 (+) Transcript_8973:200-1336(+)
MDLCYSAHPWGPVGVLITGSTFALKFVTNLTKNKSKESKLERKSVHKLIKTDLKRKSFSGDKTNLHRKSKSYNISLDSSVDTVQASVVESQYQHLVSENTNSSCLNVQTSLATNSKNDDINNSDGNSHGNVNSNNLVITNPASNNSNVLDLDNGMKSLQNCLAVPFRLENLLDNSSSLKAHFIHDESFLSQPSVCWEDQVKDKSNDEIEDDASISGEDLSLFQNSTLMGNEVGNKKAISKSSLKKLTMDAIGNEIDETLNEVLKVSSLEVCLTEKEDVTGNGDEGGDEGGDEEEEIEDEREDEGKCRIFTKEMRKEIRFDLEDEDEDVDEGKGGEGESGESDPCEEEEDGEGDGNKDERKQTDGEEKREEEREMMEIR